MNVAASSKAEVKVTVELSGKEATNLLSILLSSRDSHFAQKFADRIEMAMQAATSFPSEYAVICGVTDEMRIDFIERMAKSCEFKVRKNYCTYQPCIATVPLEMFTAQTQRIYGHTVRQMLDAAITGRHVDLNFLSYYGSHGK